MFLGQNRTTGGNTSDQRQPQLFAQDVFELDTARSARNQINDALTLQRAQMLLRGIRRFEAERASDFRARGWHPAFGNRILNEPEYLGLTRREVRHAAPVYVDSSVIIYSRPAASST